MKFQKNDIICIHSYTSQNDRKIAIIHSYAKGTQNDILRINLITPTFTNTPVPKIQLHITQKTINIKESSLTYATPYDILRNMSDTSLNNCLKIDYNQLLQHLQNCNITTHQLQ